MKWSLFFLSAVVPFSANASTQIQSNTVLKNRIADAGHLATLRSPEEYWAETGFRFSHLYESVNDARCEGNPTQFISCLAAINTVAAITSQGHVVPASIATQRTAEISSRANTFGAFELVQRGETAELNQSLSRTEILQSFRTRIQSEQAAAETLLQTLGASALPISETVMTLVNQSRSPVPEAALTAAALNAQVEVQVDPHSRYSPIAMDDERTTASDVRFYGVGMILGTRNDETTIEDVIEYGPAHRGGVHAGDVIVSVAGQSAAELSGSQIVRLLRGAAGTTVTLRVRRAGALRTLRLTRAEIVDPNVSSRLVAANGQLVGYAKLDHFMEAAACEHLALQIQLLEAHGATSLVLDLRGNGGGRTDQAVCIASLFLGRGKVVYQTRYLEDGHVESSSSDRDAITTLPLMVLIDGGSASASEILSGTLQDHKRAWIAGQRSFGKATVQAPMPTSIAGVRMWLTIARFYLPTGRTNQLVGISPDFELAPVPNATADDVLYQREEDLYTNALPAVGPTWVQHRGLGISTIRARCAGHEARVAARLAEEGRGPMRPDYMLMQAADLGTCAR